MELSRSQRASPDWLEGTWSFDVTHDHEEFSYTFTGLFSEETFRYKTCLWLPADGTWKVLEIPSYKTINGIQTDIAAAYLNEGSYIEIYIPSDLCDHSFEILKVQISDGGIQGFRTVDASYWGHRAVTGTVKGSKTKRPNKFKNVNAGKAGSDAAQTTALWQGVMLIEEL